jgi:pyrroline-5-carboxylate reductase
MTNGVALPAPTWFVGCGNMGGAMLDGWRSGGVDLGPVTIIRPSGTPVEGARVVTSVAEAGPAPKMAVLAFKPQMLDEIAPGLRTRLSAATVVVSLLAGVEAASLRQRFPGVGAVVRATANLPVEIRRGVIGIYSEELAAESQQVLTDLFAVLGYPVWLVDEPRLAAVGAVAGAGPAYVARFIAALAKAAKRQGLSEELAGTIALETVLGTAWMGAATSEDMGAIARRVASPNGTTEAGLAVLDRDDMLDELIRLTIDAAVRRGKELAQAAKGPGSRRTNGAKAP